MYHCACGHISVREFTQLICQLWHTGRTLAFGKTVKPFEWVQKTQGRQQVTLHSQLTRRFISRSCSFDCPFYKQAVSLLGYCCFSGINSFPTSSTETRNSSVVRLVQKLTVDSIDKTSALTLSAWPVLQHFSARVCPLADSYAPHTSVHATYSGFHCLKSTNVSR